MTIELSAMEIDGSIIVGVSCGGEVEVMKVKRLSLKIHDFRLSPKNRPPKWPFLVFRAKFPDLLF